MSHDPSPLVYLGTQSQETVNMAAALALAADQAMAKAADAGGEVGAAGGTIDKAATRIKADPVRAVLIAAGTGALLMILLAMRVRSGARAVKRRVRSLNRRRPAWAR
jgi:hypothetical protein